MFEQGDIIVIPFPFTDLSSTKQRPALIVSSDFYNKKFEDFVVCGITSNLGEDVFSVNLSNDDLIDGQIPLTSRIKADKLFTLNQKIVRKRIAKARKEVVEKTIQEIIKVFNKQL